MKRLPIGIQTFSEIIQGNYVYIDKTSHALNLIQNYKYVFLSRPRRFGKSLFIDTLNEIFNGNRQLFKGLYIYDRYDFEKYPVIRISWSGDFSTQEHTELMAKTIMAENAERLGIKCTTDNPSVCFRSLIQDAYEKYGKPVVILIDEYDKPILDNIAKPQEAYKRRDFLRGLYVQMKDNDRYIRFAFLTGISRFSKASIFSGLNNLTDISLKPEYATICGYTHHDLETSFAEHLQGADMERVRQWYNGYNFLGENVYNPFDILKFIDNHFVFYPYWWESGTPFSLIEMLRNGNYFLPELENLTVSSIILGSFDIEDLQIETLLFQAGYLTIDRMITDEYTGQILFKLRVPNIEVQISLNQLFYKYLTRQNYTLDTGLIRDLHQGKIETLQAKLTKLFASIPYNTYVKNNLAYYEGYYSSLVYTYLTALGIRTIAEDVTDRGRIDLTLFAGDYIYIIEFKVCQNQCSEQLSALKQIKEKKYYEKYAGDAKKIFLVGIEFDENLKNIAKFEWETIE